MIINKIRAQMVIIGMDNEQTRPRDRLGLSLSVHGPASGTDSSLCNGHGNTERTRSPRLNAFTRSIWPHKMSEITKAVFLSNFRRPAGDVSIGRAMRMGRAGASGSKNPAS